MSAKSACIERHRRHAFTLIELLVTVSLVALLAALVLTGVSRARLQSKIAKSSSNLRQIGILTAAYVSDNDGRLPSPVFEDSDHTWIEVLWPQAYQKPFPGFSPYEAALNLRSSVFWSPVTETETGDNATTRSYGWNAQLRDATVTGDDRIPFARLDSPASTVLCADSRFTSTLAPGNVCFRNNEKALLLMADGHVESRQAGTVPADTTDVFWQGW